MVGHFISITFFRPGLILCGSTYFSPVTSCYFKRSFLLLDTHSHTRFVELILFVCSYSKFGEEGICVLWFSLTSSCDSSHSALPVSTSISWRPDCQYHTSYRQHQARELRMPAADQIQTLDSGRRADKDPLDPANDFLAIEPSLQILQLNVKSFKECTWQRQQQQQQFRVGPRPQKRTWGYLEEDGFYYPDAFLLPNKQCQSLKGIQNTDTNQERSSTEPHALLIHQLTYEESSAASFHWCHYWLCCQ